MVSSAHFLQTQLHSFAIRPVATSGCKGLTAALRDARYSRICRFARSESPYRLPVSCSSAPGTGAASVFAEETSDERYFEAAIIGFEPSTGVLSLTASARCAGLPSSSREFPLLLDNAAAAAVSKALQASGLPRALAAVEDLHQKDVRLLYVNSTESDTPSSGKLLVFDLVTQSKPQVVEATFSDVISMCIRFQQPLLLSESALVKASAAGLAKRLHTMPADTTEDARAAMKALVDAFSCSLDAASYIQLLPALNAAVPSTPAPANSLGNLFGAMR
jgi:hypothetical protein